MTTITRFTKEQLIARIERQIDINATIIERLGDDSAAASELAVETATMDIKILDIALASLEAGSDSNNHPASGPLSDYRLHRIREILGKAAAQSDGGNLGYAMSDAVKAFDELLEVRKAEPVAWTDEEELRDVRRVGFGEMFSVEPISPNADMCRVIPLYTTPPAPVTIDERAAFNAWNNEDNLPIAGVGAKNAAWLAWQARAKLGSPTAPVVPETLPCPVHLEPGLKFGKGVRTQCVLDALRRRADYYAELEAMTPEERAEHEANIEAFKAMLPQPSLVVPDGVARKDFEVWARSAGFNEDWYFFTNMHPNHYDDDHVNDMWTAWNACRAAMLPHLCDVIEMEAIKQQSTMQPSNGAMSGDAVKQSSSNAQRR